MNLFENWNDTKNVLLEGLTPAKRKIVDVLLENQKKYLAETAGTGVVTAYPGAIADYPKAMLSVIRRVIPGTIATELVGVQPMTGPTGLAYSLRYVFSESVAAGVDSDAGSEIAGVNITAGDEVFGSESPSKTTRFYSSADAGTTGYPPVAPGYSEGNYALTANYESFGGRKMTLKTLKQTVTAGSRKLQAEWSTESMQDLKATLGLDMEAEMTAGLSAAIVNEIDNEIINDLVALAGTSGTYNMSGTFTGVPTWVGDRHAALGTQISYVANEIGRKTRVAPGNWIVVSPQVATVLQSAAKSVFAPAVSGSFEGPNGTKLIGTLNGSIKVYSYVWHSTGAEPVLVGLKTGNGEMGAGYFYCPYIPLMASPVVLDPNTFNPHLSLMTRYGKAVFTNTAESLGNSADWYGNIAVSNLAFA